jgi:hypothetical protein
MSAAPQRVRTIPPPPLLLRTAAGIVVGAAVGAALAGWVVRIRTDAGEPVTEWVEVLGLAVASEVVAHEPDSGWSHWTDAARATAGALLGALAGAALTARASGALGYRTFRVVEAVRGAAVGALVGGMVCGVGFAAIGAVVSAMLEERSWMLGEALSRGARLGGPFGTLLGAPAGMVLGTITALSGATKRYHALRTPPT